MGIWKGILTLFGLNIIADGKLLNGNKGGIGYGWVWIFIIIFFPIWLIYKIFWLIFKFFKLIFGKKEV